MRGEEKGGRWEAGRQSNGPDLGEGGRPLGLNISLLDAQKPRHGRGRVEGRLPSLHVHQQPSEGPDVGPLRAAAPSARAAGTLLEAPRLAKVHQLDVEQWLRAEHHIRRLEVAMHDAAPVLAQRENAGRTVSAPARSGRRQCGVQRAVWR